ncbi:MAG TPA: hypothetical protein VH640_04035 [Bryobacteraceae bacterium]
MKQVLISLVITAAIGCAQEGNPGTSAPKQPAQAGNSTIIKKLETVTWNPGTAELSWVVSVWDPAFSQEQPKAQETYTIHVDSAMMNFQGEGRQLDTEEALRMEVLMDIVSSYIIDSTAWWARGSKEPEQKQNHGLGANRSSASQPLRIQWKLRASSAPPQQGWLSPAPANACRAF